MTMTFETSLMKNDMSLRTTVPKALIRLLNLTEKDSLKWNVEVKPEGVVITVVPERVVDNDRAE